METTGARIARRTVLGAALGGGAATLLPRRAHAIDRITVATWPGEYGDLLSYTVDNEQMRPLDITVTQDLSTPAVRKAKMIAERAQSQGSLDVVCLDDVDAARMAAAGLWEPVSRIDIPNLPNIYPTLALPYAVAHVYTALVIAYDPGLAVPPPNSFADFWDPRFRNRIGFTDTLALYNIAAASICHGGSMTNMAPGLAALRDLRKLGAQAFATNELLADAMRSGAIWVAPMWLARVAYWQRMKMRVEHVYPMEGAILYGFTAGVPANAPSKQAAKRYLNAMLDPGVEATFSLRLNYAPSVSNARLTADLDHAVSFSAQERGAMHRLDAEYVAQNAKDLADDWQRDFRFG